MAPLESKPTQVQFFAPAKVNLFLHILGKRADGFHELETLMAPISLGDTLRLSVREDAEIVLGCSNPDLPTGPENLIYRAVLLFRERFGWSRGVEIEVDKRIPVGAGLGGGSSNGATTLLALRELSGLSISDCELEEVAAQLGSDVAFFIQRKPARCRGRGEIIEPVAWQGRLPSLLINPGFGVPTPWAYQRYAQEPREGVSGKSFEFGTLRNDLEPPVFEKYVWIPTMKRWLQERGEVVDALMSGSGSSVFAILHDARDSDGLIAALRQEFGENMGIWSIWINHLP